MPWWPARGAGRRSPLGEVRRRPDRSSGLPHRRARTTPGAAPDLGARGTPGRPCRHRYAARVDLALLGGGRMGEALATGLVEAGWPADRIAIAEVDAERRHVLEAHLPGVRVVPTGAWAAADTEVVVVAVKPGDVGAALESCASSLPDGALVLSIAAGVTIAALEQALPGHPVVRAMPNTGALVGRGASAIAGGALATEAHLLLA